MTTDGVPEAKLIWWALAASRAILLASIEASLGSSLTIAFPRFLPDIGGVELIFGADGASDFVFGGRGDVVFTSGAVGSLLLLFSTCQWEANLIYFGLTERKSNTGFETSHYKSTYIGFESSVPYFSRSNYRFLGMLELSPRNRWAWPRFRSWWCSWLLLRGLFLH